MSLVNHEVNRPLENCRTYVVTHLAESMEKTIRELGVLVETAGPKCGIYPVEQPEKSRECHAGLTLAAQRDRNGVKGYIHEKLRQGVPGLETCRSGFEASQREWDAYQERLYAGLTKITNIVNVPFCGILQADLPAEIPDKFKRRRGERRLPCDPKNDDMLRDAQEKLSKLADAAEVAHEELSELVPSNSINIFRTCARDLSAAAEKLRRYDHEESVNLFDAARGIDEVLIRMKPVLDDWYRAKERACRAHATASPD